MARIRGRNRAYRERLVSMLDGAPKGPGELGWRAWFGVIKRTVVEFIDDDLNDRAASLTYYGILSIFPGLLVLVAGIGLLGPSTADDVVDNIGRAGPGPGPRHRGRPASRNCARTSGRRAWSRSSAWSIAFWSATSYIGGFMRAANAIFDVPEGRPTVEDDADPARHHRGHRRLPAVSALAVVFTGRFAERPAGCSGVEQQTVRVFDIAKWPVLVVGGWLMIALLYWAAPNARQGGFRWITPGQRARGDRVGRRLGRVRLLHREVRHLQQDLRGARRRDHLPGLAVADQRRRPARAPSSTRNSAGPGRSRPGCPATRALPAAARRPAPSPRRRRSCRSAARRRIVGGRPVSGRAPAVHRARRSAADAAAWSRVLRCRGRRGRRHRIGPNGLAAGTGSAGTADRVDGGRP